MKQFFFLFINLLFVVTSHAATEPDNTAVNKRDQKDQEVTAEKHGTSKKDIQISSQLRQAIMNDKELSLYAQNIKIITVNSEVTLKGPVKSAKEQELLVNKAKSISGVSHVIDKTEVVTK